MKTKREFFCLKENRDNFLVDERKDAKLIFGYQEIKTRIDDMLRASQISKIPPRLVWYGTYGCGKTHHLNYARATIADQDLPFKVVMFDAPDTKDNSLFNDMQYRLVTMVGFDYFRPLLQKELRENPNSFNQMNVMQDVAAALEQFALNRQEQVARSAWEFLAGQELDKISMGQIGVTKKRLDDSSEFGTVLSVISDVIKRQTANSDTLLYLIDEAEGLKDVTKPNAVTMWQKAFRRIVEIQNLGIILTMGAENLRQIPQILQSPDVVRRIGQDNYLIIKNFDVQEARDFLRGLFDAFVDYGNLQNLEVSENLTAMSGYDRACFPFTSPAFEGYCKYLVRERPSAKPSEILKRLNSTTDAAVLENKQVIDRSFLEVRGEFD